MKRNRDLPFWHPFHPDPKSGFLYCCMERVLGWGRGAWIVLVIIDLKRKEYNTSVMLGGRYREQLPESRVEYLQKEGIELTGRELRTIRYLFKSKPFKRFLSRYRPEGWEDTGWIKLDLFTTSDSVHLYSELFDFYHLNKLPFKRFWLGAWWWTRGLRHIYDKIFTFDQPKQSSGENNNINH